MGAKDNKPGEPGLKNKSEEQLRKPGVVQPGERQAEDLFILCNYLKGDGSEVRVDLSRNKQENITSSCTTGGRFRLDSRRNFFTPRVAEHWNRLPRESVVSPSLEGLKSV